MPNLRRALRATAAPSVAGTVPCLAEQVCRPGAIRTAELGNRDKRALLRLRDPEPAVSASNSSDPTYQNPAKPREFLGLNLDHWGSLCSYKLHGGGGSLERTRLSGRFPIPQGKRREILQIGSSGGSRAKMPERFQRRGDRFPVNRKGVRFRRAGKSRKSIPFFKPS